MSRGAGRSARATSYLSTNAFRQASEIAQGVHVPTQQKIDTKIEIVNCAIHLIISVPTAMNVLNVSMLTNMHQ